MPRKQTVDPDFDPTMDRVIDMLHGDDLYYHQRVKRVLSQAGFKVSRVEREEVHPIWHLWLKRGSFPVEKDNALASRQVRQVLKKSGLKVKPDEFRVLRQDGDRLRCVFMFTWGAPGTLT
ncbi:MAG TPA: hypothetical protein VJA21_12210 [Verrucomicrobiae bacterium]